MATTFRYPSVTNARLSAISVAYKKGELIGSKVAPKVKAPANLYEFPKNNRSDGATIPETKVSTYGETNLITFSGSTGTGKVVGHGLHIIISEEEKREAALTGWDIEQDKILKLTETIINREEVEIAAAVQNAANYGTNFKVTLSGNDQFSAFSTSDPVKKILQIKEICKPNVIAMGSVVWFYLRRHPKIISYLYPTTGASNVKLADFASEFGFRDVLVGDLDINTAEPGLTPVYAKPWLNHMAFLQVDDTVVNVRGKVGMFFNAYLPLEGIERIVKTEPIPAGQCGVEGGMRYDLLEKKEIVATADDLGYLITDAVVNDFTSGN